MTVKLELEFHVVKGIQYKQGLVPAMLISTQHKQQWLDSEASQAATEVVGARSPPAAARAPATTDSSPKPAAAAAVGSASPAAAPATARASGAASPAVKKGFLNSAKTSIYPETVKFKGSAAAANAAKSTADILLPSFAAADPPQAEAPAAAAPAQQKKKATGIQDLGEVKSAPREDPPKGSDSAVKDREKEKPKPKPIAAGADMRAHTLATTTTTTFIISLYLPLPLILSTRILYRKYLSIPLIASPLPPLLLSYYAYCHYCRYYHHKQMVNSVLILLKEAHQ